MRKDKKLDKLTGDKNIKYMGSKSKIVDYILPIIQERIENYNIKTYIEPFCGGCNVIDKVVCNQKIASDNHRYLIAMYQNLDKLSLLPDFVTREHYSDVRDCFNKNLHTFEDWYIGAIGFLASYNGRFFDGGYAGLVTTKVNTVRNYYDEAKRNLEEQILRLKGIEFKNVDYQYYTDFIDCLFYLDPPYKGKKAYGSSKGFNHDEFWNWCRHMSEKNIVLISEQEAPPGFECIWQQEVKRTIDNNKRVKAVEKLFEIRE